MYFYVCRFHQKRFENFWQGECGGKRGGKGREKKEEWRKGMKTQEGMERKVRDSQKMENQDKKENEEDQVRKERMNGNGGKKIRKVGRGREGIKRKEMERR